MRWEDPLTPWAWVLACIQWRSQLSISTDPPAACPIDCILLLWAQTNPCHLSCAVIPASLLSEYTELCVLAPGSFGDLTWAASFFPALFSLSDSRLKSLQLCSCSKQLWVPLTTHCNYTPAFLPKDITRFWTAICFWPHSIASLSFTCDFTRKHFMAPFFPARWVPFFCPGTTCAGHPRVILNTALTTTLSS